MPQASTGFSPFELVYGRNVRGPLDVLKESWEASTRSPESVVSYVMMERLQKLRDIVHENLQDAQNTQKQWYDRNARRREFRPGNQVLILLIITYGAAPTRKISDVNYEVRLTGGRKRNSIFHINMLREWHSPSAASFLVEEITGEGPDDPDDVVLWDGTGENDEEQLVICSKLPPHQRAELAQLLQRFGDVLSSRPSRTQAAECRIRMGTASRILLPPYRLPHAYRDIVKSELVDMEREGIIERSSSEWAFPIVLVKKKDGSLHMCVDYRRLMDQILIGCIGYAAAYFDDVIIHSNTWEDHICHITEVLRKLKEAGLTIRPKKCQFGMERCSYLGHVIGNGEVRPEEAKTQAVSNFPTPTTKKRVRALLGLTGYYRKFLPDCADIAAPLTDLTNRCKVDRRMREIIQNPEEQAVY